MGTPSILIGKPADTSATSPSFTSLPPLALYVHLPWCVRKCPYCDFNSHRAPAELPEANYLAALTTDLDQLIPLVWGRRIQSIFIGGGTPSLFTPDAIDRLLADTRARLPVSPDAEVTLEANPGAIDAARFSGFRDAGINRISLGVQSFNDRHLRALGRVHDAVAARRAAELAASTFANFNLDLMFALPGQTSSELAADLATALAFAPPHLSIYHLTIEPNTVFARHPPAIPDDDHAAALQGQLEESLATAGYDHYEVSAFARTGFRCRHNLNYWTFGDYLGIGAGAHTKITFPDRVTRQVRTRNPTEYMSRVTDGRHIVESTEVDSLDLPFEFMMNALRLSEGFPVSTYSDRTGLALATILKPLAQCEARRLLERDHAFIRPTALGRRFLNDLVATFLPE